MRAVTLTNYLEVARLVGLDPFEMLRNAGISPEFIEHPESRYSARAIVGLLEDSARESGRECFGLMMAECRNFASLGPLSLLLQHLPTVRDVVEALIDYRLHMNELLNFALDEQPGRAAIRLDLLSSYATPQIVELSVAMAHIVIRGASGGRWQPTAVHFMHRAPQDLSVARRLFAAPIKYDCDFNGLATTAEALAIDNPLADDMMAAHARRLLGMVPLEPEHNSMTDRTRRAITLLLPTGWAALESVAQNLGLTPRALQRGLEKEGGSFASVHNEIRRELVQRYLIDSDHSVSDIARLTGYSSLSAFGRWFSSEFGQSAHAWRTAHRGDATSRIQTRHTPALEESRH